MDLVNPFQSDGGATFGPAVFGLTSLFSPAILDLYTVEIICIS